MDPDEHGLLAGNLTLHQGQMMLVIDPGAEEMKGKLAKADGRAARLAKNPADEDNLRELYAAALCRPPNAAELQTALAHLHKPREDAEGKPLDAGLSRKSAYEDLVWALVNTKEFLFNH
jgi:hypothetical protein